MVRLKITHDPIANLFMFNLDGYTFSCTCDQRITSVSKVVGYYEGLIMLDTDIGEVDIDLIIQVYEANFNKTERDGLANRLRRLPVDEIELSNPSVKPKWFDDINNTYIGTMLFSVQHDKTIHVTKRGSVSELTVLRYVDGEFSIVSSTFKEVDLWRMMYYLEKYKSLLSNRSYVEHNECVV